MFFITRRDPGPSRGGEAARRRPSPRAIVAVDRLEERLALSRMAGPMPGPAVLRIARAFGPGIVAERTQGAGMVGHIQVAARRAGRVAPGPFSTVVKAPHFYEVYTGPQRADLNVVAAGVTDLPGRGLILSGTMQGRINPSPTDPSQSSIYVWGFNRGSPRAITPFQGRPGITFDAVVAVEFQPSGPSAFVVDLASPNPTPTPVDPGAIRVQGRTVLLALDPSLLPTPPGGVPISQYTFNLWPRISLQQTSDVVASFIPEDAMAPVVTRGVRGPRGPRGLAAAPASLASPSVPTVSAPVATPPSPYFGLIGGPLSRVMPPSAVTTPTTVVNPPSTPTMPTGGGSSATGGGAVGAGGLIGGGGSAGGGNIPY